VAEVTDGPAVPDPAPEPPAEPVLRREQPPAPGRAEAQAVLDEAARLAGAAGDWARRAVPELAALLRGDRPEVTGKLAEAGTAVAAAARAVVDAFVHPPAERPEPAAEPEPGGEQAERRVQRIEID
jgi:hypothetical protein